ncbi:MAG: hypothetical protein AAFP97_04440 [Pseudomonadota bacterium]
MIVSLGLVLFSGSALQHIELDRENSQPLTTQSQLDENWANLDTLTAGNTAGFNTIALNSLSVLERAPLEEDALAQIALSRHAALTSENNRGGLDDETLNLLRAAQRVNPRNRTVANTLYRNALNVGKFDEAVSQLDLLYRITHPQRRDNGELMDALAALISLNPSRDSVIDALGNNPSWGIPFLIYMFGDRDGARLSVIPDYLAVYAQNANPANVRNVAEGLIRRLAQDNQYAEAHTVWTRYWRQDQPPNMAILNADPDFRRTAPSPFGWVAFAGRDGSADFEPGGGLYATYHNGPKTVLAEQMFLWPNTHDAALKVEARGRVFTQPRSGHFRIELDCYINTETTRTFVSVGGFNLSEQLAEGGSATHLFSTLNPECQTGRLRLVGVSGDISQTITASLQNLSISMKTDGFK